MEFNGWCNRFETLQLSTAGTNLNDSKMLLGFRVTLKFDDHIDMDGFYRRTSPEQ